MRKIGIIGAGSWGTALAIVLQKNNHDVTVWSIMEDEIKMLSVSEIECITVIDRRVIAIDTDGCEYKIQDRLRELEDILPSYFIRINKSTLANEHKILRFNAAFSGGVDAVFECGYKDYVSRRCFAEIKRRYEKI